MKRIIVLVLACCASGAALAQGYPVSGAWGQSTSSGPGPIDCSGKRVIDFNGNQRTDSKGGVPAYRNRSVTSDGPSRYRVVDEFTTGQVSNAHTTYTLQQIDENHIEMTMPQGTVKLQKCK